MRRGANRSSATLSAHRQCGVQRGGTAKRSLMRVAAAACRCCSSSRAQSRLASRACCLIALCAKLLHAWSAPRAWLRSVSAKRIPLRLLRIRNLQSRVQEGKARFRPLTRLRGCALTVVRTRTLLRLRLRRGVAPVCACKANDSIVLLTKESLLIPCSCVRLLLVVLPASCQRYIRQEGARHLFGAHV